MIKVTVSFVVDDRLAKMINLNDSTDVLVWMTNKCWYWNEFGIEPNFEQFTVEKVEVLENED